MGEIVEGWLDKKEARHYGEWFRTKLPDRTVRGAASWSPQKRSEV